jgi:hypothetical protein
MIRIDKRVQALICAIALVSVLCGCGGSNGSTSTGGAGSSPPPVIPPPPEAVQGIATPSNVSVVTATNAG